MQAEPQTGEHTLHLPLYGDRVTRRGPAICDAGTSRVGFSPLLSIIGRRMGQTTWSSTWSGLPSWLSSSTPRSRLDLVRGAEAAPPADATVRICFDQSRLPDCLDEPRILVPISVSSSVAVSHRSRPGSRVRRRFPTSGESVSCLSRAAGSSPGEAAGPCGGSGIGRREASPVSPDRLAGAETVPRRRLRPLSWTGRIPEAANAPSG